MIEGHLPFYHESIKEMYKLVLSGKYTPMKKGSPSIQLIVDKVFEVDPECRISISELISSLTALSRTHQQAKRLDSLPTAPVSLTKHEERLKHETIVKILKYNGYSES
jgi:serine/threonine protein kinase